jgi:hypothetical protein
MRFDVARPVDLMDNAAALPTTPQAHSHNRSGQFICYLHRSVPIVGDMTASVGFVANVCQPSTLRMVI